MGHKKCFLFSSISTHFTLCTDGNRNKYSIEESKNLKQHDTAHFKVSHYGILLLSSKTESVSYLKCFFVRYVQNVPVCTDTRCQLILPLISSNVNNVIVHIFPYGYQSLPTLVSVVNLFQHYICSNCGLFVIDEFLSPAHCRVLIAVRHSLYICSLCIWLLCL